MTLETVHGNWLLKQDRNKHQCLCPLLRRLRYHITCVSGSTSNQGSTTKGVSKCQKKMIRLLRHDPTVLREEDGAVEFRILAPMFHSKFTSSPCWSNRTWLNYLQKEVVLRRDFSTVWIHTLLIRSCSFEQVKATLEENTLILHCKTTCCYRATSPSASTTLEASSHDLHSIIQSGLIPGGKDVKKGRRAVFFTAVNPMFIDHSRERDYDVTKPRIAVYKHKHTPKTHCVLV